VVDISLRGTCCRHLQGRKAASGYYNSKVTDIFIRRVPRLSQFIKSFVKEIPNYELEGNSNDLPVGDLKENQEKRIR
jgi:hypothetical protein